MGFTPHEAYKLYWDFMKNFRFGEKELEEFLTDMRGDAHVGTVQ